PPLPGLNPSRHRRIPRVRCAHPGLHSVAPPGANHVRARPDDRSTGLRACGSMGGWSSHSPHPPPRRRGMPVPSPATSAHRLDQARGRCASAWDRLVALYTPLLDAWLTAAGLQPADREDLTQRALEILVRQLPDFEHSGRPGAFRAWLRGITVNLLREFWRGRPEPEAGSVLDQISD